LHNLPPEFPHAREFLHDVVLPGLSGVADRYDASWEIVPVNVFLHPWMSTIDRDLLQPMLTKVLTVVQKFLLKCTGENTHKNYDIELPWKQVAWPDVWNGFVNGVIIPYLKRELGNVYNKPPLGGMAATDAWVDHLMRWHQRFCPRKCLTSYRVSSLEKIGRVLCAGGSSR
jgi:hypothetical protein